MAKAKQVLVDAAVLQRAWMLAYNVLGAGAGGRGQLDVPKGGWDEQAMMDDVQAMRKALGLEE